MDKLWAPWREHYITSILKKEKGCIFCNMIKSQKDRQHYIFRRSLYSFAVLNIYPYNNGHILVLPKRHVKDISLLSKKERDDLLDLLEDVKQQIQRALSPHGFNIGMNIGKAAGAGYPGHVHIHIVPRWKGDVNFMPVLTSTKVISQSLKTLYKKLIDAHKKRH